MTTNKGGGGNEAGTDTGTHDGTTQDGATTGKTVDGGDTNKATGITVDTIDDDATTTGGESQGEVFFDDDELDAALNAATNNDSSTTLTIGATHESIGQRTARLAKRQAFKDQWFARISTPNTDTTGLTADDFSGLNTGGLDLKPPPVNQSKSNVHPNIDSSLPFTPRAANTYSQALRSGSLPAQGLPSPSLNHRDQHQSRANVLKLFSTAKATTTMTGRDFQLRSVTREQKLAQSEKIRLEFRKLSCYHTPTLLAYIHPSAVCKANTEQTATLANFDRFLAQQRAHANKFGFNYLYAISLAMEDEETGVVELYEPAVSLNLLDINDYPHIKPDNVKLYLKYLVHDAPYKNEDEYNLVLEELEDSYQAMTKSFDKDLFVAVKSEMVADSINYPDYTRSGPMALAVAFQLLTIVSPHSGRTTVEQIVALDLRKFEGENVNEYINHCRTLLNRIPNARDRADEFYDIIFTALKKSSVKDFVFDLQSWHATRRHANVTNIFDHNALLKQALQTYHELNSRGQWLPTKKSVNLAQKKDKQKKDEKSESKTKPAEKSTADKMVDDRKKNKWPAWRREAPKAGESHTKTSNKGNKVAWCATCEFWGNHLTKDHKSKETLEAEKAAKAKESAKPKTSAPKSTSFSDGTAPDS
jgi:hypothetical protein